MVGSALPCPDWFGFRPVYGKARTGRSISARVKGRRISSWIWLPTSGAGAFGARLTGSYVRQQASDILVRVTSPSQPFVGRDRLAIVRRDPGDIVALGVHPFYRLARTFALTAGLDHWSHGTDVVSYSHPELPVPGVDASVCAEDSKANATMLSVGVTYANPGGLRPGGTGLPVDASWTYERVLRAGGGRVPDTHAIRATTQRVLRSLVARSVRSMAWAWRRAASPSASPSIRAISLIRSSPCSTCTSLVAMPRRASFETTR